ncbi:UvrD-helicase domain-containing protein [Adlercreutzia caecimuris]|uniref:UvrD-helicase domain-containing protein n=1 Tax=Adlercreutzia caecimuris TaxID=671266 RepID=UPI001364D5A6|nr:UvrD-helicase domain-containing protein [Adlercreutzia caecimuris]NBJ67645.1 hypothetical protein [Adlercreutzia caecimuris]
MDDLDQLAFSEEATSLKNIEDRIDALIKPHEERIAQLSEELSDWHSYTYDDDHDRKMIKIKGLEESEKKKSDLEIFKPEPYFCHLRLVIDGNETRDCYIGEHSHDLRDEKGAIILSWKSPYREAYISKTKTHFDIEAGGHKRGYDVRLRRKCSIANAELLEVRTELDDAYGVLHGQISDPFLISVLNDKRRDFDLTNIIKTIQENQNDILDRPLAENFIVQGCAGSGKTMVLLHRLSCLAFDPKNRHLEYVIITPSDSFNHQIAGLCNNLDIDNAAQLTVEKYYARLITALTLRDIAGKESRGFCYVNVPKITLEDNAITPDWDLPKEYLKEIYSDRFYKKVQSAVEAMKKKALGKLKLRNVEAALEARGFHLPAADSVAYDLYKVLSLAETRIEREVVAKNEQTSAVASNADKAAMTQIKEVRSLMDVRSLKRHIEKEIEQLKQKHRVSPKKELTYRYELYIKSLLCVMYYGRCNNAGSVICIDEAQDLSPSELRLIRTAAGPSTPISLYGDTGQNVCPYKGISKWSDVPECVATTYFELNENYRNTLQITEYCNKKLRMNMTPIGLRGPDVARLKPQTCIEKLFDLRNNEDRLRCAVIYKYGLTEIEKHLKELLGEDGSYDEVDTKRISVIPVEASKGLEFDAVVAIEDGLTRNERYIAFTRALTYLFVSRIGA